jgi:hypothetical protein
MSNSVLPDYAEGTEGSDSSIDFETLLRQIDEEIALVAPSMVRRFSFELDGLDFEVRRIKSDEGYRFLFTTTLGYLPFTIQSRERREAVQILMEEAQGLPTVHFIMGLGGKITAGGLIDVEKLLAPDFLFYPLILFIQEARPFLNLLSYYLKDPA